MEVGTIKSKKIKFVIIGFICCLILFISYCHGVYLNALDATIVRRKVEGRKIVENIKRGKELKPLWAHDGTSKLNVSSSTEFFDILISAPEYQFDSEIINLLLQKTGKESNVCPQKNIWTVVKNLPPNAPDNFVVLVTRNIDAESLVIRLNEDNMDDKIKFLSNEENSFLKYYAIIIRKDGSSFVCKRPSLFFKGCSYRAIYNNQPFDISSQLGEIPVSYLTPVSEVYPQQN